MKSADNGQDVGRIGALIAVADPSGPVHAPQGGQVSLSALRERPRSPRLLSGRVAPLLQPDAARLLGGPAADRGAQRDDRGGLAADAQQLVRHRLEEGPDLPLVLSDRGSAMARQYGLVWAFSEGVPPC